MKLVVSKDGQCSAAALAMALDAPADDILRDLYSNLTKPWPVPWNGYQKVPSIDMLVDYAWYFHGKGMVPFTKNPTCTPQPDCPTVPVWLNGDQVFKDQLNNGKGLLEGRTTRGGHMCAWDGVEVFDPRGYIYRPEEAAQHEFEILRFWMVL